ncbi:MAG: ClbS/DfsB family four-helix bundle protein [Cohaesibacteraceae bacterium]
MAAINRDELHSVSEKEFARLTRLLDDLEDGLADKPDPANDDLAIKQIIAHRVHWLGLFFVWYDGGKAGEDVQTPAPGYKWNQLKAYNAKLHEAARDRDWAGIRQELEDGHARLMAFIDQNDDETLYTKHVYPWMNNWTLGRWVEASGPSHYRSAAKVIRSIKKNLSA